MATAGDMNPHTDISASLETASGKEVQNPPEKGNGQSSSSEDPNPTKPEDEKGGPTATPVTKEREAAWGDYFRYGLSLLCKIHGHHPLIDCPLQRCFSYGKNWDFVLMAGAAVASIGAGVTMPLMNVVFGKLVGSFASFGTAGSGTTSSDLGDTINRQCLYMCKFSFSKNIVEAAQIFHVFT